ncbi:N-acetylmuramoyl-L-alanine amidase [Pseudoprimorskyibacter insulae]|uniref:N-acetylmuramoyl-L-alanine amidase n=1 Tax=Pseudoprimorskyibacter insulae TaxID=1695997 RepID=A0A2R8AXD1_9RHOB|nr:N-acetylmuramoyl-L-alanine amidase [Pseudoprimorskyibacter insulae]SPF80711.1 N-acetylmuramoyl-L-alanine amidase AmiC [Pseudoprimorskyibacter insulae]
MSRIFLAIAAWLVLACAGLAQPLGGLARVVPEGSRVVDAGLRDVRLEVNLSQGVPFRIYTLAEPMRLVVDFREVDWTGANPVDMLQTSRVAGLRFGRVQQGWSRLVVDLREPMAVDQAEMKIGQSDGTAALQVRLTRTTSEDFLAAAGAPREVGAMQIGPLAAVTAPKRAGDDRHLVVMIDPGHGGIDPGAQNGTSSEAQLMLIMARELQEVLRRSGGFDAQLTRDADEFVSLEARVAKAHRAGADVFVSLHADALDEGVARGATVYTLAEEASDAASAALAERHNRDDLLSGVDLTGADDHVADVLMDLARLDNTPRSQALAQVLVDSIRNSVGRVHKRPLRQAGFSVLKAADIPSVLIELGFLSTNADLKNLRDPIWRAGMAAGIRDGLQAWALEDAALSRLRRQ